jgi:hypothetical protein
MRSKADIKDDLLHHRITTEDAILEVTFDIRELFAIIKANLQGQTIRSAAASAGLTT